LSEGLDHVLVWSVVLDNASTSLKNEKKKHIDNMLLIGYARFILKAKYLCMYLTCLKKIMEKKFE
jgi:hypothetical protein